MKQFKIAFAAIFFLKLTIVYAQTATPPAECHRRCTTLAFEEPEYTNEKFKAKLKAIQERKKGETNPEKLKELEDIEKSEMDDLKDSLDRMCRKICKY
ncbi:hypothetical protein [Pseudoduganella aquatica]|uniref:hypothetical protein n=1 Tax=Pseudoduganella aquatica TaxID=2660641 RepID=UPI001E53384C|nr:hypothetical protein [Pseudoduganella aquatica]